MQLLELVQALQVGGSDTGDPIGFQKEARQRAGWQTDWYPGQLVAIQVELLQLFHATQGVRFDLRDLVLVQHQQLHLSVALEITGTQHAQVVPFCLSNRPEGGGRRRIQSDTNTFTIFCVYHCYIYLNDSFIHSKRLALASAPLTQNPSSAL